MNTLITTLFQSQIFSHYRHLTTKSYAEHMTLGTYYDAIPDFIDALTEIYQKNTNSISVPASIDIPSFDTIDYFSGLSGYLKEQIPQMPNEGLKNKLTEVLELVDQTLYRLTLK